MRKGLSKIIVTGGAGFIGSAFVRLLLDRDCPRSSHRDCPRRGLSLWESRRGLFLSVIDKLTYAGDLKRLEEVKGRYKFYKADISDKKSIEAIFKKEQPDAIIHFAAETHVDRSIADACAFVKSNFQGTQVLLDASRKYGVKKFLHISTDEVYGDILKGKFNEDSPLKPNSPYAASKAAADLLVKAYTRTYKFPAIIVRPSNNYGPWQYPEKFIPVVIAKALMNKKVPVYAKGLNVREWLYVEDTARAIETILNKGKCGEVYNLGSAYEEKNINLARRILTLLCKPQTLISFVADRPGHDFRYSLNFSKLKKLGYKPKVSFISHFFTASSHINLIQLSQISIGLFLSRKHQQQP